MAAAGLRHAARRLSGSALRQTQEYSAASRISSAVKRRFAHTEVQVQHPCTCGKFERDAVMNPINKQKEALFDAIAAAEKRYPSGMNRALLRELSGHVKRSGNPTWDSAQMAQIKHDLLKATGCATMVAGGVCLYFKTLGWLFQAKK